MTKKVKFLLMCGLLFLPGALRAEEPVSGVVAFERRSDLLAFLGTIGGGPKGGFSGGAVTNPILAPNGTVCGAPAYAFSGNSNSGLTNTGAGQLSFCELGNEQVRIINQQVLYMNSGAVGAPVGSNSGGTTGFFFGAGPDFDITVGGVLAAKFTAGTIDFNTNGNAILKNTFGGSIITMTNGGGLTLDAHASSGGNQTLHLEVADSDRITPCGFKTLSNTSTTLTTLAKVAAPSNSAGALYVKISVRCNDGTNFDSDFLTIQVAYKNHGGTITFGTPVISTNSPINDSGSCTIAPTITDAGGNVININVTPVISTIAPTTTTGMATVEAFGLSSVDGTTTCQ